MKFLVIGSGGREHALAWKLSQSPRARKVYVAPGNAGTALEPGLENIPYTAISDLVEFAQKENIGLTIVGPEIPLAEGIVDIFSNAGLKIFGPTKKAVQLEASKTFSKDFMQRHGIPTADSASFDDPSQAHLYIEQKIPPIVIKANGLAAGKGVVIAMTLAEAHATIDSMLIDHSLGAAGTQILIEEYLEGQEASFIVMTDGHNILPLATSQDHKRLLDYDQGPNTGGMGAFSPAPIISPTLHAKIMREVITPAIHGMARDGELYTGFLYAGLMITSNGEIKVLEFNCRMGDPETQPIMLRLKTDLTLLLEHAMNGTLDKAEIEWDRRAALGVVMAAEGYPGTPRKNEIITGLTEIMTDQASTDQFHVFHSGTKLSNPDNNEILTSGGRVLCITALGENIKLAHQCAYDIASKIHFAGCQMRRDIGFKVAENNDK